MSKSSSADRIERYVQEAMTEAEIADFMEELERDEALQNELHYYQQLQQSMRWNRQLEQLDRRLEEEGFFAQSEQLPRPRSYRWWWAVAAALALLIAGMLWWQSTRSPNWDSLATVEIKDIDLEAARIRGTRPLDTRSDLSGALAAIAAEDYSAAESYLQAIPAGDSTYARARLLLSYSALALEEYPRAGAYAREAYAASTQHLDRQKAEWLQLKASVGAKRPDRTLLDKIASDKKHRFSADALRLKAQLP